MIEQRTPEWFAQRASVSITGSMCGAVLGLNPWTTREAALRAKVREKAGAPSEFTGNAATEWGTKMEPTVNEAYQSHSGNIVFEAGFVRHPEYDWIGVSPDGYVGQSGLTEYKAPYSRKIKTAEQSPHYYAQIQLQLHTTSREWCDFVVWTPERMHVERVLRDPEWMEKNLAVLYAFHEEVLSIMACPDKLAPFIQDAEVERTDETWAELARKYINICSAEKALLADKEALRKQLIAEAGDRKTTGENICVYPSERPGTISYAKAFKDLLPEADLSNYRGSPSVSWTIKVTGDES